MGKLMGFSFNHCVTQKLPISVLGCKRYLYIYRVSKKKTAIIIKGRNKRKTQYFDLFHK